MIRAGLTHEEAKKRFVICNANGALGSKGGGFGDPNYTQGQVVDPTFSSWMSDSVEDGTPMLDVVKSFKPTVLLGLSAQPKIFTESLIR
jgi:malic enzyme